MKVEEYFPLLKESEPEMRLISEKDSSAKQYPMAW
jgi:hypothetical protein